MNPSRHVFVAGGSGYIGRAVVPRLLARGHRVRALARPGSEGKLPPGCEVVQGDALKKDSFTRRVSACDTFLQLVGVAHPSPSKARLFREIDLASALASGEAALEAGVAHFVYLSVAQPAPAMKDYLAARAAGESFLRSRGFASATFLRPWYVLGPGHRWPYLLLPGYWAAELFPPRARPRGASASSRSLRWRRRSFEPSRVRLKGSVSSRSRRSAGLGWSQAGSPVHRTADGVAEREPHDFDRFRTPRSLPCP